MKSNGIRMRLREVGIVVRFALKEHYRALSVRILLALLLVAGLVSMPLLVFFNDDDTAAVDTGERSVITKLYVRNETPFPVEAPTASVRYAEMEWVPTESSDETMAKLLAEETTAAAVVISQNAETGQFAVDGYYGEQSEISGRELDTLCGAVAEQLYDTMMQTLQVTQAQMDLLKSDIIANTRTFSDYQNGEDVFGMADSALISLLYSYLLVIVTSMAMGYIVQLCMEEKQSKLVELVLISVKPISLLTGKIVAVTCFLLVMLVIGGGGVAVSYLVTSQFYSLDFVGEMIAGALGVSRFPEFTVASVLLCVVGIVLAYLLTAFLAVIFGSACSRTEDVQPCTLITTLFIMLGYLGASFLPMMNHDVVLAVTCVFPLTGMFCAPIFFLCGKISGWVMLLAFAVQILTIVGLAKLSGTIYRAMIFYRGQYPSPAKLFP